ncbi:glycosyltransferase family 2 protein [Reyranella sp.]|uniref:glycosyltransferase family 2 protein n=1 Tax=Reyranella sp. TaxID=1929291 RepID=UPI003D14755B
MGADEETVGVVVPMYNAERTIAATLASICAQTHRGLDIVVTNDGSTDGSAAIVEGWCRCDPRVRLVRQGNAGVAAARNTGAAATPAQFLAFVDADDIWAPTKIEYQLAALREGGPSAGLAYCWYASIDQRNRVVSFGPQPLFEGQVVRDLCEANWIGNGSSLLLRREAFERVGGYEPGLRARRAQGAEDLLMCLRVAEVAEFRVVPRYLVGYRMLPDSMSADSLQMFRSTELVLQEFLAKYPQYADELDDHLQDSRTWFAYRAGRSGRAATALLLLHEAFAVHPVRTAGYLAHTAVTIAAGRIRRRIGRKVVYPLYTEVIW